jgi:hypothetical protein
MFLRSRRREKDGKDHTYWPLVETARTPAFGADAAALGSGHPFSIGRRSRQCTAVAGDEGPRPAFHIAERGSCSAHHRGREIGLRRITEPTTGQKSLLQQLGFSLPSA